MVSLTVFSFSPQVNSDVVFYSRRRDGTLEPVKVNRAHVGRMILTKAPGLETSRDITEQYKFPEGQRGRRSTSEKKKNQRRFIAEDDGLHIQTILTLAPVMWKKKML